MTLKPLKASHKPLNTLMGDDLSRFYTCRSAGQQREDPLTAGLVFIAIPNCPDGQIRTIGSERPGMLPKSSPKLQDRSRGPTILQSHHCFLLLRGQWRIAGNVLQG